MRWDRWDARLQQCDDGGDKIAVVPLRNKSANISSPVSGRGAEQRSGGEKEAEEDTCDPATISSSTDGRHNIIFLIEVSPLIYFYPPQPPEILRSLPLGILWLN